MDTERTFSLGEVHELAAALKYPHRASAAPTLKSFWATLSRQEREPIKQEIRDWMGRLA